MDENRIIQVVAKARGDLNAAKGRADGNLHDAITVYTNTLGQIYESQRNEIAMLTKENKTLKQENQKLNASVKKLDNVTEPVPAKPPTDDTKNTGEIKNPLEGKNK
jgi:regulator of replication initiation timing